MLPHIEFVRDQLVAERLFGMGALHGHLRHALDRLDGEVEPVELVEHHHVEGRRRGALLDEAAHMHVGVVGAAIGQPVDEMRIAVEGEDHRPVAREQAVEFRVRRVRADARHAIEAS